MKFRSAAIPSRSSLGGLQQRIDAFQEAGAQVTLEPVEQAVPMLRGTANSVSLDMFHLK